MFLIQTLGDETKRHEYDQFGRTSAQQGQQQGGHGFHGGHGGFDSMFNQFFHGGGGFHFNFPGGGSRDDSIDKHRINFK